MRNHLQQGLQAHTDSYYAATANAQTAFEPLQGDQSADICVVGAGFTGISTALHLAERGYNVAADAPLAIMVISDRISAYECIWHGEGGMNGVPGKGVRMLT